MNETVSPASRRERIALVAVVGALYFSEGFPFGVVTELLPLYLRTSGVSLSRIGLLSTIGAAWTLKFLWAPLVDSVSSYRAWARWSILTISTCLCAFAAIQDVSSPAFWAVAGMLAIASATQDVAVDALAVSKSTPHNVGTINSTRITTYRIAIIVAAGGLPVVAGNLGWPAAFCAGAALSAFCLSSTLLLPDTASEGLAEKSPIPSLRRWLARTDMAPILAVALLYKLGDSMLAQMVRPFWVDAGYGVSEIGTVTTTIGVSCTIAGGIIGGFWITKRGLYRSLVELGAIQLGSNAGYAVAALLGGGRPAMYTASVIESISSGLGTAAYLSFLMTVCDKTNAATEFALLTALMGLSRMAGGTASGFVAQSLGYQSFFWLTIAVGLPGLLVAFRAKSVLPPPE